MKASWFENKELITLYTDSAYFGADVPPSYEKRSSQPVPVDSLFGYEPDNKMDDIHHKDSMLKIALQMKSGTWDGPPIVVRKDPKGYQVLDGHHRMHAARKAGIDTLDAVVVDREDIEYSDEVKEQTNKVVNESYELEFVCVNPDFCDATEQKNQDSLFQALKAVPGVIVYKQDFDVHNSMAAIIKDEADKDAPKLIKRLAQQNKVAIDLKNNVNQRRMDDIITGRLEGLTDYYDTDYLSEASGYIPTAAQANDPRFKTALTVDVRPGEDQRNISKLGLDLNQELVRKTSPGLKKKKPSLAESLMERYQAIKEEDLLEVDMGSGALRSWAKSPEAQGVNAGFELELILPDTENADDEDDEADMDADEPIGTLNQIVDFYDGPSGMGAWTADQPVDEEFFRDKLTLDLIEYEDEQFFDWWRDNGENEVREEMEATFERNVTDEEFMEEFENEGQIFQDVREREQDERRGNTTWAQFWESQQIETMSDLLNVYDLYWPYNSGGEGGSKELDEWAEEISAITGKGTNVSYQYHGSDKEQGKYTLEPDSSITADENQDAGIELVSPVMPLGEAVADLEKLMKWADDNDVYTNSTTGLHMNISVPQGNDIDYTKLVLFSGDKYILDKYDRLATNYAPSVLTQLQNRASQMDANTAATSMQKMKTSLQDAAEEFVKGGTGMAKYSSIHIKDGYIEFRGPGGIYTNKDVSEITDTMLRFARAMTIAADPQAHRQEYQKKLYKLLNTGGKEERTIDSLFAELQAGTISQVVFKKRWANLVVKQTQNQQVLNKLDGKPDDARTQKAKAIQKDLAGPPKRFRYTLPYQDDQGNEKSLEGIVTAASAQLAMQAAVDDTLKAFEPNGLYGAFTPKYQLLKVDMA